MEKKLTMILACLFLSVGMAVAQTKITGTVISSEDNEPVIGASVTVVGTNTGAATNIDGVFEVTVPNSNSQLEISYVGMISKKVRAVNGMKVVLDPDNKTLNEVMVVAYGTQKKSSFTGSAAVVSADEIGKVQVTNAVDALKGKAAGVQINTASGQPGSTPTMRIRGINSINANSRPLLVVDGSPFDGDLNTINPVDIESMTVLKDAASTSLYGARGGNGIILITTKSGKKGKGGTITVDAKWGQNSKATPEYNLVTSPAKYYEVWYEGLYNYARNMQGYSDARAYRWANDNLTNNSDYGLGYNVYTLPEGQTLIGTNGKLNPNATLGRVINYKGSEYTLLPDDWVDATYGHGLRQEYTVSATGSTDRSNFYMSVNYLGNEGITAASDYKRFTGRLKADYQMKPWLKLTANGNYAHYERDALGNDGSSSSSGNAFAFTTIAPIYPIFIRDGQGNIIYDEASRLNLYDYGDGTIMGQVRPYMTNANPLAANQLDTRNTEGNTFNAVATAEIRLPYDFTFTSINNVYLDEYRYTNITNPFFGSYKASNGIIYKSHGRTWSLNYQQRLGWHKQFGVHDVDLMAAHEYYKTRSVDLEGSKSNMYSPYNKELRGAVILTAADSYDSFYNDERWIFRGLYNILDRYFLQASFTHEASSRFSKENGNWWGNFWSAGGGWLINKEPWFKAGWVDELKLKTSYGESGNDLIGDLRFIDYYAVINSNDEISIVPQSKGNKDISWEKAQKFNIGVDFSFFRERLSGTAEFFSNRTRDMLSFFPLAPSYGWSGYYRNVGNMTNKGFEFSLRGDIIRTNDITWTAYANITTQTNRITKLAEPSKTYWVDGTWGYSSGNYFYGEGKPMYERYMKKYAGVDQTTGEALYWKNIYEKYEGTNADAYYDINDNLIDPDQVDKVEKKHRKPIGTEKTTNYADADYYLCGGSMPKAFGGFGTSFSWKGLDVSVDFAYQLGGKVFDSTYASLMAYNKGTGIHVDALKAWTVDNPSQDIPRHQFNDSYTASTSDRWLISAAYLSLQNITVGYTLPRNWVSKLDLSTVRVYMVADNIWTWSKRQGMDPRQSISGANSNAYYKPIRTISGGITVSF